MRVLGKVTPLFLGYQGSGGIGKMMQDESVTIDQLIAAHWGTCDVGVGETPEDYASRHEEQDRLFCGWDLGAEGVSITWVRFSSGRIEILAIQSDDFWRLKES